MSRKIIDSFETYQNERKEFVQKIADLAKDPENIEPLHKAGKVP